MRRSVKLFLFLVVALALCSSVSMAAEHPQVVITPGTTAYTEAGLLINVTVTFADISLYNEQVYLSYHILDENGGMLAFENQRLPLSLDENNNAWMTVSINNSAVPEASTGTIARIQFDLVDEQNIYWFSDRDIDYFQGAEVIFECTQIVPPSESVASSKNVSRLSVALNLLVWSVVVWMSLKYVQRGGKTTGGGGLKLGNSDR